MPENVEGIFAKRLREAMDIRQLTATDICRLAKAKNPNEAMPKSGMSGYLNGNFVPKPEKRELLADLLHVNEDWLIGLSDKMEKDDGNLPEYLQRNPADYSVKPRTLAEKVRSARMSKRLSQRALGDAIGLRLKGIQKIEKGERIPTTELLEKIANATGVPLSWFLEMVPENDSSVDIPPEAKRKTDFAERLQKAMKLRGLNQSDIVRASAEYPENVRINKALISAYLQGRYIPSPDRTNALAEILSVNPLWLIGAADKETDALFIAVANDTSITQNEAEDVAPKEDDTEEASIEKDQDFDWREQVFLKVIGKDKRDEDNPRPDDFSETFDYVLNKLPDDLKTAIVEYWSGDKRKEMASEMEKAISSMDTDSINNLASRITAITTVQETAIRFLRQEEYLQVLQVGLNGLHKQVDAIKTIAQKMFNAILLSGDIIKGDKIQLPNVSFSKNQADYKQSGIPTVAEFRKAVKPYNIASLYLELSASDLSQCTLPKPIISIKKEVLQSIEKFIMRDQYELLKTIPRYHRTRIMRGFLSKLEYYWSGNARKEFLGGDRWREFIYQEIYNIPFIPKDKIPENIDKIIDEALCLHVKNQYEMTCVLSYCRDGLAFDEIAQELGITSYQAKTVIDNAFARIAKRESQKRILRFAYNTDAKVKDDDNTAPNDKPQVTAILYTKLFPYAAMPSPIPDEQETYRAIIGEFTETEIAILEDNIINGIRLQEVADGAGISRQQAIATRIALVKKLKSPRYLMLMRYGKTSVDTLEAPELERKYIEATLLSDIHFKNSNYLFSETTKTTFQFMKGVVTLGDFLDYFFKESAGKKTVVSPLSGEKVVLPSRTVLQLIIEEYLECESYNDKELADAKRAYESRIRDSFYKKDLLDKNGETV